MTEKVPMTLRGYHKLEDELRNLISKERPAVISAIEEARQHGDLSENAEYHAAKEKQGFIEGRIAELESKISRAEVIDPSKISGATVKFGTTVTVCDDDTNEVKIYQIVGADEADISKGLLSYTSPLAKSLIGKSADDFIEVTTPGGIKSYTINKIEYR